MKPIPRTHTTDQQRHARAGRLLPPPPPTLVGDKARLNQGPRARPVPTPLVVAENTFVIRGKDNTYLGFAFGDGRQVQQVNLYDHLPADRVPHLSNYVFDLTGIIPDAIGIDLGGSIGVTAASGVAGLNVIWHTRGEGNRARFPEVHVYHGWSGSLTAGAIIKSLFAPPNAAGAAQVILGWATEYDSKGVGRPAPSRWIANGFNWTGYFYNIGISIPVYGKFSLVGSYFQSVPYGPKPKGVTVWKGICVGVGVTGKFTLKVPMPFFKFDMAKLFSFKIFDRSANFSRTEYGMVYGNGGDFIPQRGNEDISGGHMLPGINQNKY